MVDQEKLEDADAKIEEGTEEREEALTGQSGGLFSQTVYKKTPALSRVFFKLVFYCDVCHPNHAQIA